MIELDGELSVSDVVAVARENEPVSLTPAAIEEMKRTRSVVNDVIADEDSHVYGINAGVGALHEESIPAERLDKLHENIIKSTITNVGPLASTDVIRAAMLVRANSLATGASGVRPTVVRKICSLLNEGLHPQIHLGGTTDDLTAIAHVGMVLLGKGEATLDGELIDGREALREIDIEPLDLAPKEAMSLISGTPVMTGILALCVHDTEQLVRTADTSGALTFALLGDAPETFAERITDVRPHTGHAETAENIRSITDQDTNSSSHEMVQDPLSLRVIPQVHGTVRAHLEFARETVETELVSPSGNPLIFPDGNIHSCGAFNGQPIASAGDSLKTVVTKLCSIAESRTKLLLNGDEDSPFLAADPGIESGLMMSTYTSSGLLAESLLTGSASDHSVTVSAGQEDVHSMGTISLRNLEQTLDNVRTIVAIELLCANRYVKLASNVDLSAPLTALTDHLQAVVDDPVEDVSLTKRIQRVDESIKTGDPIRAVESGDVDLH